VGVVKHQVIGVVGASGGLGTSTLAVALAVRAAEQAGLVGCVDADFEGGGLDVTACLEHLPGLRWPDLDRARGELDGPALLRSLPQERSVAVLAARGPSPGVGVVDAAIVALAHACGIVVLDLGRSLEQAARCDALVLVAGTTVRHLSDADALARRTADRVSVPVWIALRPRQHCPVQAEDVAVQLDLPLAAVIRHDPRAERDAERAAIPGTTGSAYRGAADELLTRLGLVESGPRGARA
jgi:hypothetical protein